MVHMVVIARLESSKALLKRQLWRRALRLQARIKIMRQHRAHKKIARQLEALFELRLGWSFGWMGLIQVTEET